MSRVDKPVLLRRLFEFGCSYSGQILSYQKMIGQLQDAGNTTTLAHYLELLKGAGLITGLPKYAGQIVRQRASSPKLLVLNTALMAAHSHLTFAEARAKRKFWGRIVESAIGAALANSILGNNLDLYYWTGRNREVDFILARGEQLIAFEVKSNFKKTTLPGITAFSKEFSVYKKILVGGAGLPMRTFFETPVTAWFR
jgi:predicted AAA+ superfamily ATPase